MPNLLRLIIRLLLLAPLLHAGLAHSAPELVDAYNTYLYPPFLNEDGSGLASELVGHLNTNMRGKYRLRLNHLPRRRLMEVEAREPVRFNGVGLLLVPAFVNDDKTHRFLWSEALFPDYNVLIFSSTNTPPVASAADLKGMRFGAILGNRYLYLEELLASASITRHDTSGERLNLRKVLSGRIEFTQMNRLLFNSMAAEPEFLGKLTGIPEPGAPPFMRRVFVGPHRADLLASLNSAIAALHCDRKWRAVAGRYGIAVPPCAAR